VTTIVTCPRDPGVETALRCSRCETPICPRCLVHSPVGARCKDCARLVRSPIYVLGAGHIVRAALAAILGGLVMGFVWLLILLPFQFGFVAILLGVGLGYAFTRLLDFATGRKRGPLVVAFAIVGIVLAWSLQVVFIDIGFARYGLVAVGIGAYFAYQNLK
jgi:hypothetical protein